MNRIEILSLMYDAIESIFLWTKALAFPINGPKVFSLLRKNVIDVYFVLWNFTELGVPWPLGGQFVTLTICCDYVCVCFLELSTLFFLTRYDFVAMKCNVNHVGNILLSTSTFCIIHICECVSQRLSLPVLSLPELSIICLKKRKGCFSLNEAYM